MKERIMRKLQSVSGETVAEVLISLLISALALAMLATMIQASSNMITTSKTKMKEYYTQNNILGTQEPGNEESTKPTLTLEEKDGKFSDTYTLTLYKNDLLGGVDVISYKGEEATTP